MRGLVTLQLVTLQLAAAMRLAVVGTGGLGRELCVQSCADARWHSTTAVDSNPEYAATPRPVLHPWRGGGLDDRAMAAEFTHPSLTSLSVDDLHGHAYDALIFACGASAFEDDSSDTLMRFVLDARPAELRAVTLVSAYGAGEGETSSNLGIWGMSTWYLRDVYRAKRAMEAMLAELPPSIRTHVVRPRALSYGPAWALGAMPRQELARSILDRLLAEPTAPDQRQGL
jgi:hypothetical protein